MTSIGPIACALPRAVDSSELFAGEDQTQLSRMSARAGVLSRPVAEADETAFDLSVRACEALIADHGVDLRDVDAIVYCTQTPDYVVPGNAHLLHAVLGLGGDVLAFDYNLACSGYVYGLAFADSFVRSGLASKVLLVTAETYSKRVNKRDRTARMLFGDGAAVTLLSAAAGWGRIVACKVGTDGSSFERAYVPAGGARRPRDGDSAREVADRHGNVRSAENLTMDGLGAWASVRSVVPDHLRSLLDGCSLTLDDVDLFVLHQASRVTLEGLTAALGVPREKVFSNVELVGNLVSASIPVALRAALDEGALEPGALVLLAGFGAGLSYGSVLVQA